MTFMEERRFYAALLESFIFDEESFSRQKQIETTLKQRRISMLKRHSILLKRINVEIGRWKKVEIWRFLTLKYNVVSMLKSDVETSLKIGCFPDVEINNVVSTLKIGCSMSRPKINLKTTLKQRCVSVGQEKE